MRASSWLLCLNEIHKNYHNLKGCWKVYMHFSIKTTVLCFELHWRFVDPAAQFETINHHRLVLRIICHMWDNYTSQESMHTMNGCKIMMMLGVLVLEMTLVTAIIMIRVMQSSTITMTNDIIDNNYKNVDDDNNGENYYSYIFCHQHLMRVYDTVDSCACRVWFWCMNEAYYVSFNSLGLENNCAKAACYMVTMNHM